MSALLDQAAALLAAAKAAGADVAETVMSTGTSVSVQRRLGKIEETERAESRELGLRVFVGKCSASVSASAIDPAAFTRLAEQAVAMARVVPEDIYAEIPGSPGADGRHACWTSTTPIEPATEILIARAAAAEEAALAVPGITNSEGASASWSRSHFLLATTRGFAGFYTRSNHGVSATAIAGTGTDMQRDYDFSSAAHAADLDDPAALGRKAAERALARLHPTRPKTARLPVLFDPRVAGSMLGHLSGAIHGASIARGTSFLKDSLGQPVFATGHPHHRRPAARARPPLPPLRPRGPARHGPRLHRGRRADQLDSRHPQRQSARPENHRPCRRHQQFLSRAPAR